jgi:hypothetical protein
MPSRDWSAPEYAAFAPIVLGNVVADEKTCRACVRAVPPELRSLLLARLAVELVLLEEVFAKLERAILRGQVVSDTRLAAWYALKLRLEQQLRWAKDEFGV